MGETLDAETLDELRAAVADGQVIEGWENDLLATIEAMKRDSLDAAWAEAEAALPEGWALRVQTESVGQCWAEASSNWRFDDDPDGAEGPTPAAALRALAAKLRGE